MNLLAGTGHRPADRAGRVSGWLAGAASHDPAVLEPSLSLAEDTGETWGSI